MDLAGQTVTTATGEAFSFDVETGLKQRLLTGFDDIDMTLQHGEEIRNYEAKKQQRSPWLFNELT